MSPRPEQSSIERKHHPFWIVDPDTDLPMQAEGYECASDYWWFPSVNYSIPEARCHATAAAAAREAIADLERRRDSIETTLTKLREGF